MFNIRILCLYNIMCIRPSRKETSFSSGLFLVKRGRPLLFTIYEFFGISFEDGRHVFNAHCG